MSDKILFYGVGDEHGAFSNFAPYPISLDGRRWPTSEHYFQAQKFLDPKLLLLATGDSVIVEHTEADAFWGDGGDGSGKNMLGRILMEVRTRLPSAG